MENTLVWRGSVCFHVYKFVVMLSWVMERQYFCTLDMTRQFRSSCVQYCRISRYGISCVARHSGLRNVQFL